jgi:hypothetical protein
VGDFILYFNFFCELDTLSLHSLLLLLAPEQIPLEVIGHYLAADPFWSLRLKQLPSKAFDTKYLYL